MSTKENNGKKGKREKIRLIFEEICLFNQKTENSGQTLWNKNKGKIDLIS